VLRMEVPATGFEKGEALCGWNELKCIAAILYSVGTAQIACRMELRGVVMEERPESCKRRRVQRGQSVSELGESTYDAH
jgi:hypothetical protein